MKEIRVNLLAVTAMGVVLCIFAFYKLGDADKVALIVSGFIGAIGATLIQLVKPPPPEEEPAPEAQVPVSGGGLNTPGGRDS